MSQTQVKPQERRNEERKREKSKNASDPNDLPQVGNVAKAFFKLLTSVKRVGIQYNEDFGTTLPGYMDSTQFVGHNFKERAARIWFYIRLSTRYQLDQ